MSDLDDLMDRIDEDPTLATPKDIDEVIKYVRQYLNNASSAKAKLGEKREKIAKDSVQIKSLRERLFGKPTAKPLPKTSAAGGLRRV